MRHVALLLVTLVLVLVLGCSGPSTIPVPDGGIDDAGACGDGGAPRCEGGEALVCEDGVWSRRSCAPGVCAPGLGCVACVPNRGACDEEGRPLRCRADGSGYDVLEACDEGLFCATGTCVDACSALDEDDARASNLGCEHWAISTLNGQLGAVPSFFMSNVTRGTDGFVYAIAVANPHDSAVRVRVTGRGTDLAQNVAARSTAVIALPWVPDVAQTTPAGLPVNRPDSVLMPPDFSGTSVVAPGAAYAVRANAPVIVYQFNPLSFRTQNDESCTDRLECFTYSNDASLLLPRQALGTSYVVMARPTSALYDRCDDQIFAYGGGFVTIVGDRAEPTRVRVTPTAPVRPGPGQPASPAGVTIERTLGPGDVWQLVAAQPTTLDECEPLESEHCTHACRASAFDLTGTRVESDAPVAVLSGHDCADVPSGTAACDHLEEQLLPTSALGRRYVAARPHPQHPAQEPVLLRVVATRDGTRVTFRPSLHDEVELDAGEHVELVQDRPVVIEASDPVAVAQFLVGAQYFVTRGIDPRELDGDPAMVLVPPVDQWRTEYPIHVPDTYVSSFLTIAADEDAVITLDGTRLEPLPLRTEGYAFYDVPVTPGPHRLLGTARFSVLVEGFGPYTSYAYPGGTDVEPILE